MSNVEERMSKKALLEALVELQKRIERLEDRTAKIEIDMITNSVNNSMNMQLANLQYRSP